MKHARSTLLVLLTLVGSSALAASPIPRASTRSQRALRLRP